MLSLLFFLFLLFLESDLLLDGPGELLLLDHFLIDPLNLFVVLILRELVWFLKVGVALAKYELVHGLIALLTGFLFDAVELTDLLETCLFFLLTSQAVPILLGLILEVLLSLLEFLVILFSLLLKLRLQP